MSELPNLPIDRSTLPIGIYDSGIGGLTVARALRQALPAEDFIYFGDTAHLPYGDKSVASIQAYSVKIADMLLRQPVKAIVIACFSATTAAGELMAAYVDTRALVFDVMGPAVEHVAKTYAGQRIGLIGTRQTVASNAFMARLQLAGGGDLRSLATPLLAPMIEDGFVSGAVPREVIHTYLQNPVLDGIEALVLACTHYPLIREQIEAYYTTQQANVAVLDCSVVVAAHVADTLAAQKLARAGGHAGGFRFFVSDLTRSFEQSARLFFGQDVALEHYPLWS